MPLHLQIIIGVVASLATIAVAEAVRRTWNKNRALKRFNS